MDEPPIHYYTIGAPEDKAWRTANAWPIPEAKPKNYFFGAGPSGSVSSVNDGALGVEAPTVSNAADKYTVDYNVGMEKPSRGSNVYGHGMGNVAPAVMNSIDGKGLTYSTAPLTEDTVITGYPVAHLWVSSTVKDGDFFVYLAEVDQAGKSVYVTEGKLRASNRAIAEPPYKNQDLPWHRSYKEDNKPLPREPVELVFALQPTSKLFRQGSRIRITVVCGDKGEYETPVLDPPPVVSVYRESAHPSYVVLPVTSR